MRGTLAADLELDDDPARVDRAAVHEFVSNHSYWAPGRSRARQDELIERSARIVGLYHDGRQVGFTRTISDGHLAYLADVYVLPEYRGRGLGADLVRESVDRGPYAACPVAPAHGRRAQAVRASRVSTCPRSG
jgi:GNAT superfamily N-acetyltransferase